MSRFLNKYQIAETLNIEPMSVLQIKDFPEPAFIGKGRVRWWSEEDFNNWKTNIYDKKPGRVFEANKEKIKELLASGESKAAIGRMFGFRRSTTNNLFALLDGPPKKKPPAETHVQKEFRKPRHWDLAFKVLTRSAQGRATL